MRFRLIAILTALLAGVLLALTVPLARNLASAEQHRVYLDRLNDANRFAALLQDAQTADDLAELDGELERYHEVHPRIVAVRVHFDGPTAPVRGPEDLQPSTVAGQIQLGRTEISVPLGVARNLKDGDPPPQIWPWESRPLVVAVPARHVGQLVGAVLVVSDSAPLRGGIGRLWALLITADLAVLAGCVLLASRIASWILRPVVVLDDAAHRISTGQLSARVPAAAGPVELRRLGDSFNTMATAVEDSMRRQRAFVADASHQLRNPLSALMLRLGILGVDLPPERAADLQDAHQEVQRLARIIDDLLELATAEQEAARRAPVDLPELVAGRLAAWAPLAAEKHVTLRLEQDSPADPAPAVTVLADPVLVGSALDAVLDNAVKFGPAGAEVRVRIDRDTSSAVLEVQDLGPGVSAEELARLGDRFWRSPRHQNIDGTGLGLSIARQLIALNDGSLTFRRGEPTGLVVAVRLPLAGEEVIGADAEDPKPDEPQPDEPRPDEPRPDEPKPSEPKEVKQ
jgi:signal transduction histidine kinase